jgi:ABC-2 type transport system permease protein
MKGGQILAFIVRDLKVFFRDKTALFWLIAWPLIWVFMVAFIFLPPGTATPVQLDVGVVNYDTNVTNANFTSQDFIKILSNVTYEGENIFKVKEYKNESGLVDDLRHGKLDVGIIIPENFSWNLTFGTARLKVLIGAKDTYTASINYGVISGFLNEFSRRVSLVKVRISIKYAEMAVKSYNQTFMNQSNMSLGPKYLEYMRRYMYGIAVPLNASYEEVRPEALATRENLLGWYVIGAVGMVFLYSGFSQGAAAIYRERSAGSLRRILASPITPTTLISALILSNIVILLVSAAILIVTGVYGTGAHIIFNPVNPVHWLTPILLLTAAYMSLGIGLLLAPLAKTEHGANSMGISLGLFLAFTAGIWFPKEWMPQWMQVLAEYFPVTWVMDTLRNVMVYNMSLSDIGIDLIKIAVASLVILVLDVAVYKAKLRKYITTY